MIVKSSAKNACDILCIEFNLLLREFIVMINSSGPNTEPCGTPQLKLISFEYLFATFTLTFRCVRKLLIQRIIYGLRPVLTNALMMQEWSTESKARA